MGSFVEEEEEDERKNPMRLINGIAMDQDEDQEHWGGSIRKTRPLSSGAGSLSPHPVHLDKPKEC